MTCRTQNDNSFTLDESICNYRISLIIFYSLMEEQESMLEDVDILKSSLEILDVQQKVLSRKVLTPF